MNRINRIVMLALGPVVLGQAASAQSNCKDAIGNLVEVFPGGDTVTGTLTNGGWLDGKTVAVFFGSGFPTPVPTQVTFASTFTLTTGLGQIKGTRVYLYDFVALKAATMTIIDPGASSGIFAGATGVLYNTIRNISSGSPPTTFDQQVSGQICFAK